MLAEKKSRQMRAFVWEFLVIATLAFPLFVNPFICVRITLFALLTK
jgi:hypothetical protein